MKKFLSALLILALLCSMLPLRVSAADTPGDYGWQTDEGNFSGWSVEDAASFRGDYSQMTGSRRMWQTILRGKNDFSVSMKIHASNLTRVYFKIFGVKLELDGLNGTGHQLFVKFNENFIDWYSCTDCVTDLTISRVAGGDITFTLRGADNETPVVLSSGMLEDKGSFEVGMYSGTVHVSDLTVQTQYDLACAIDKAGYEFRFSRGNDIWNQPTDWTTGRSNAKGLWVRSAVSDGSSALAAYVGERLSEDWLTTATFNILSEGNGGRAVSRMYILDQHYHGKLIFSMEKTNGHVYFSLQSAAQASGATWTTHWTSGWLLKEDTAYTVTLRGNKSGKISLQILGDSGYSFSTEASILEETAKLFCYLGLSAEKTETEFSHVDVIGYFHGFDAAAEAKTAYENLVKNYINPQTKATYGMEYGLREGYVTNIGMTVHVAEPGGFWDVSIVIMAMDTYARTLDPESDEYREVAEYIANSVNRMNAGHGEKKITTAGTGPVNWAMDDCGWNIAAEILGYRYNMFLGRADEAATCLDYGTKLFNSTYELFYDEALFGGLWYNTDREVKALYAATVAICGWDLFEITGDSRIYSRMIDVYNGIEDNLRREDGLYWIGVTADGVQGKENPYGIREGGSCSYIGGNMAMAVMNARLGNYQKAADTAWGISRYETTKKGAYLNDRDAWNNTFFLGMFQREVVNTGIVDDRYNTILLTTAESILENAVFEDGYYSAAWEGPQEPSSNGYPADYTGTRNNWGNQQYGHCIGSFPAQSYTSATTAHVIIATAAIMEPEEPKTPGDFGWSSHSEDFTGWVATDERNFSVDHSLAVNSCVWKDLLQGENGFTFSAMVTAAENSSAYIKFLGQTIELDARGGNGDQVYLKLNGQGQDWMAAQDGTVKLSVTCLPGSKLLVTLQGNGQDNILSYSLVSTNWGSIVELGSFAGVCTFARIAVTGAQLPAPGEFGWYSDSEDLSGWKAMDGETISVVLADAVNGRIWKPLLSDQKNFSVDLDVVNSNVSSTYIKVLGVVVELDSNHGNGNQTFIKVAGNNYDWLAGTGCQFHVNISRRNGGDLSITVTGAGNENPFTLTTAPTEENGNVEVGLFRGVSSFLNITAENGITEPVGPIVAADLVFRNKTLSLQSYIAFNITARNSVLENYDSWYVVFERYDYLSGAVVTETVASVPYSTSYQLFEYKVSSYMMSDSITATLYAVKDGVTYKGEVYTDSVENFVISRMAAAAASSADLATLYANLLTYGAKAQTFLGYNVEALADAKLGEYASYVTTTAPTAENLYAETANGLTGATKNKLALGISSAVQIQLRINLKSAYDVNSVYGELTYTRGTETITQRIDGKDFTKSGSRYVLVFDAITAVDGRAPVQITIYDGNGTAISETWTYSISSYLVDGGLSGNGLATMEALLNYFDSAAKVFG